MTGESHMDILLCCLLQVGEYRLLDCDVRTAMKILFTLTAGKLLYVSGEDALLEALFQSQVFRIRDSPGMAFSNAEMLFPKIGILRERWGVRLSSLDGESSVPCAQERRSVYIVDVRGSQIFAKCFSLLKRRSNEVRVT